MTARPHGDLFPARSARAPLRSQPFRSRPPRLRPFLRRPVPPSSEPVGSLHNLHGVSAHAHVVHLLAVFARVRVDVARPVQLHSLHDVQHLARFRRTVPRDPCRRAAANFPGDTSTRRNQFRAERICRNPSIGRISYVRARGKESWREMVGSWGLEPQTSTVSIMLSCS